MAQTKKKGSFRVNVIATFLLISVISLGVTGVIALNFVNVIGGVTTTESQDALQEQIQRNMVETAEKTALVINQKLSNAEAMVSAMAEECENLFRDNSDYQPRETYFHHFFEYPLDGPTPDDLSVENDTDYGLHVSWDYSSWYKDNTDAGNYDTVAVAQADTLGRVSNLDYTFKYVYNQMPQFRWLYVAFTNGLFMNYPGSMIEGEFYFPDEFFYTEIENGNGDMVYVEPYFDPIEQVLMISIGRAIYDPDNSTMIGIVAADIPYSDINDRILGVQILESGYASLLLSTDAVVAHPTLTPQDYADIWDAEERLPTLTEVESLTAGQVTDILSVGPTETGILNYTHQNQDRILAYTQVGKGDYICIIVVPTEEVLEPIEELETRISDANLQATTFIIGLTVIGVLLAAIVAGAVTNQITKPLEYLMGLAMKNVEAMIKQEDLGTDELQVDTTYTVQDDEIGELARAFQGMLDSIKEDE